MNKTTTILLGLSLVLAAPHSRAQVAPEAAAVQSATDEGVRRQAARVTLRQTLANAQAARDGHNLPLAAKLYDDSWGLVQQIGPRNVPEEVAQIQSGLAAVRLEMAHADQH